MKKTKTIISIMLSVLMLFTALLPAAATVSIETTLPAEETTLETTDAPEAPEAEDKVYDVLGTQVNK